MGIVTLATRPLCISNAQCFPLLVRLGFDRNVGKLAWTNVCSRGAKRREERIFYSAELCLHHHSNHVVIVTTFWVVLSPELHLSLVKWLTTLSLAASPIASNFHYYKKSDERMQQPAAIRIPKQFQGILIRSALTPEIGKIRLGETKIK